METDEIAISGAQGLHFQERLPSGGCEAGCVICIHLYIKYSMVYFVRGSLFPHRSHAIPQGIKKNMMKPTTTTTTTTTTNITKVIAYRSSDTNIAPVNVTFLWGFPKGKIGRSVLRICWQGLTYDWR